MDEPEATEQSPLADQSPMGSPQVPQADLPEPPAPFSVSGVYAAVRPIPQDDLVEEDTAEVDAEVEEQTLAAARDVAFGLRRSLDAPPKTASSEPSTPRNPAPADMPEPIGAVFSREEVRRAQAQQARPTPPTSPTPSRDTHAAPAAKQSRTETEPKRSVPASFTALPKEPDLIPAELEEASGDELALAEQLARMAGEFTAEEDDFWNLSAEPEETEAPRTGGPKRPAIPARLKRAAGESGRRGRIRGRRRR
jgi:hypothetical protein